MANNEFFGEAPKFDGNVDAFLKRIEQWAQSVHDIVFGPNGSGGTLNGENIESADDPGVADGTEAGNAATINALTTNLQSTGLVKP